jgi:hypothetical protein
MPWGLPASPRGRRVRRPLPAAGSRLRSKASYSLAGKESRYSASAAAKSATRACVLLLLSLGAVPTRAAEASVESVPRTCRPLLCGSVSGLPRRLAAGGAKRVDRGQVALDLLDQRRDVDVVRHGSDARPTGEPWKPGGPNTALTRSHRARGGRDRSALAACYRLALASDSMDVSAFSLSAGVAGSGSDRSQRLHAV